MNVDKIKRNLRISALVAILTAGACSRLSGIENIRLVELITILVCGIGIGAFIVNLRLYFIYKQQG